MDPTIESFVSLLGVAAVVIVLMQIIKPVLWPSGGAAQDRFGALVSVITGLVVSIVGIYFIGLTNNREIGDALVNGFFGGASAAGLYSGGKRLLQG